MLGVNDSTNTLLESSNTFQKFSYPTDLIKGRKKCFHRVRNPELNDFNQGCQNRTGPARPTGKTEDRTGNRSG